MANVSTSRSAKSRNRHSRQSDALFYGELPIVADATFQLRSISSALMGLAPEAWNLIRCNSNFEQLAEATSELRATIAAIAAGDDPAGLAPLHESSPRQKALRTIKRACLRLATTGVRDDFKLAEHIFRAVPELEAV